MKIRNACVVLLALSTVGCIDRVTVPDGSGVFTATVTGGVNTSFDGVALFGVVANQGFSLALTNSAGTALVAVVRFEPGRPGTGTHQIVHHESEAGFIANFQQQSFEVQGEVDHFLSESGEFVITTSRSDRLVGSFSFQAVGFRAENPDQPLQINVTGSFDAVCIGQCN